MERKSNGSKINGVTERWSDGVTDGQSDGAISLYIKIEKRNKKKE